MLKNCNKDGRDFDLASSQGRVCGGRGDCECKECVCQPGWSGKACNCQVHLSSGKLDDTLITLQESTEPCLVEGGPYGGVYDGLVCAGNGKCRYVEIFCKVGFQAFERKGTLGDSAPKLRNSHFCINQN